MAYVMRALYRTKDTACVDVCPVDCIHPRKDEPGFESSPNFTSAGGVYRLRRLRSCLPVTAIFALEDLPEKWPTLHR